MAKKNLSKTFISIPVNLFILLLISTAYPAFESLQSDARSRSLANANTALNTGIDAVSANPAHLGLHEYISLSTSFFPFTVNANDKSGVLNFSVGGSLPLSNAGTVGIKFNGLFARADQKSLYSEYEIHAAYGYGFKFPLQLGADFIFQKVSLGQSLNLEKLNPVFNMSLGFNWIIKEKLSLGFTGKNILSSVADLSSDPYPYGQEIGTTLNLGAAYLHPRFNLTMDFSQVFQAALSLDMRLGGELFFAEQKLRTGFGLELLNFKDGIVPSLGVGLSLEKLSADYTFAYPNNIGGPGIHLVTFSLLIK